MFVLKCLSRTLEYQLEGKIEDRIIAVKFIAAATKQRFVTWLGHGF